jgi:hypothetical protein
MVVIVRRLPALLIINASSPMMRNKKIWREVKKGNKKKEGRKRVRKKKSGVEEEKGKRGGWEVYNFLTFINSSKTNYNIKKLYINNNKTLNTTNN